MLHLKIRAAAAAVAVIMIIGASGCENKTVKNTVSGWSSAKSVSATSASVSRGSISLPYARSRTMNPFITDCQINETLWPLIYDCLSEPDSEFKPVNRLASSIDNRGTTVTVHLKKDVKFSDGSLLTAKDVSYSFSNVMANPGSNFYAQVADIAAVSAPDPYTVLFTLKVPDPYIANVFTIPVIKNGSDKTGALIGSGRYIYKQNGKSAVLSANGSWYGGSVKIKAINLVDMPDNDSMFHSLEIGTINYLISDSGTGTKTHINASTHSVSLSQIAFLGVNSAHSALSDPHVRKAISLAVDRQTMAKESFSSHAKPTVIPFSPDFKDAPKQDAKSFLPDFTQSRSELQTTGFKTENTNGVLTRTVNGVTQALTFTLIVNKENTSRVNAAQKIAYNLNKIGFSVKVSQLDYNTYLAALQNGSYDLYIGEIRLTEDLSLAPFYTPGGAASHGITAGGASSLAYTSFLNDPKKIGDFITSFKSDMPFIPLCFRIGSVACSRDFPNNIIATNQNIFYNIEQWHF